MIPPLRDLHALARLASPATVESADDLVARVDSWIEGTEVLLQTARTDRDRLQATVKRLREQALDRENRMSRARQALGTGMSEI